MLLNSNMYSICTLYIVQCMYNVGYIYTVHFGYYIASIYKKMTKKLSSNDFISIIYTMKVYFLRYIRVCISIIYNM